MWPAKLRWPYTYFAGSTITMASRTVTATTIEEEVQKFADEEVARDVRDALDEMHKESIGVWGAVPTFIYWIRTKVGTMDRP